MSDLDILDMSDEEFEKLAIPVTDDKVAEPTVAEPAADEKTETPVESEPVQENTQPEAEAESETSPEVTDSSEEGEEEEPPASVADAEPEKKPETEPKAKSEETPPAGAAATSNTDYEGFFKQVMAPFKANGKVVQLQSADEAIALMQMGANYTKKMQAIQQHKKYLMMLENNGLLDEEKLSLLIDLDKKNPEAIKKYLQDAKVDPIDLDTSGEVNYKTGSHKVSDQEAVLASAIEDLNSLPNGKETLQSVHTWDNASKEVLWNDPGLLNVIHSHRENGIYAHVCAEIERRKAIGQIHPNAPFLQAYMSIGNEMSARGALPSIAKPAHPIQQPVATRPAKTPATKATETRVRAAAAPRTVSRPASLPVNVLAMNDEEFLKLSKKV